MSAYLLDEWKLHPRLSVSAGLRLDKYRTWTPRRITPRLAFIARPYERASPSWWRAAPSARPTPTSSTTRTASHPGRRQALEPETITTFELEHSHDLTDELRVTVAGYHNRISSLVSCARSRPLPVDAAHHRVPRLRVNADDTTLAWGAEAGVHWQPGRWLLVDVSYSYVTLRTPPTRCRRGPRAPRLRAAADAAGRRRHAAGHAGHLPERPRSGVGGADNGEALLVVSASPATTARCATSPACTTCWTRATRCRCRTRTPRPRAPVRPHLHPPAHRHLLTAAMSDAVPSSASSTPATPCTRASWSCASACCASRSAYPRPGGLPLRGDSLHLVAHQGDTVLGCVLFNPEDAHGGRLFQMAVASHLQGQGLGARLVRSLEEELRSRGFTHVHLHARGPSSPSTSGSAMPFTESLSPRSEFPIGTCARRSTPRVGQLSPSHQPGWRLPHPCA